MITEFTIGCSHTINLGNFESLRVEATITFALPENCNLDAFAQMKQEAQTELRQLVEETYRAQSRNKDNRAVAQQRARAGIWSDPADRPAK